jgi:hypothetical protein
MSEPWFDPNLYAWIPGTALGVLGGFWGSMVGVLAPRGKGKAIVLGSLAILLGASVVMLGLGILAILENQPYGVWYGFLLAGVIGVIVLGSLAPVTLVRYREAEMRKMEARDL